MKTNFLNKNALKTLTTKRLLAYKNKLMKVPETPDWNGPNSICKTSPSWVETYQNVKDILSTRENVK